MPVKISCQRAPSSVTSTTCSVRRAWARPLTGPGTIASAAKTTNHRFSRTIAGFLAAGTENRELSGQNSDETTEAAARSELSVLTFEFSVRLEYARRKVHVHDSARARGPRCGRRE